MSSMSRALDFPFFSVFSGPGWHLEERVKVVLAGNPKTSPIFRVTDEHRERWPEAYAHFRSTLSYWTRLRLWVQAVRDRRRHSEPSNPMLDVPYGELLLRGQACGKGIDDNIDVDIRAALAKHEQIDA